MTFKLSSPPSSAEHAENLIRLVKKGDRGNVKWVKKPERAAFGKSQ